MIIRVDFKMKNGVRVGEAQLRVIPCTISSVTERNDYCPTIADGNKKTEIIKKLNQYSKKYGVVIADDGLVSHG